MNKLQDDLERKISNELVIATTTFYNLNNESDFLRANLVKNSVKKTIELGYKIVIVDGGSSDELLRDFEKYGAIVCRELNRGMGNSRRQAIREAYNTKRKIIAWTEPEKEDYITKIIDTAYPIMNNSVDLVVPKRKSMQSYPTAQQYAEPLGNAFWKEITNTNLDIWFGPRTFKRELSSYFLNYKLRFPLVYSPVA